MKILINSFFISFMLLLASNVFAENMLGKAGTAIDDVTIATKIMARYADDPLLNPFKITVATENGVVTLTGQVDSDVQFERAMIIAESTQGVKDVNGKDLKVKSSDQPFTDTYITAKIKGALLKNEIVEGENYDVWSVHVETKNGTVFLTGKIKDAPEKGRIIELVKSIDGVKDIQEDLQI